MTQVFKDFWLDNEMYIFYGVGAALIISFLIFFILFVIHRNLLNQEYWIKKEFNSLEEKVKNINFSFLKTLSNNNNDLSKLVNDVEQGTKDIETKMVFVKEKIYKVALLNKKFYFLATSRKILEVKKDLAALEIIYETITNAKSFLTSYSENVNEILVKARVIINDIINFYKKTISLKYDKNQIESVFHDLSKPQEELDKLIVVINYDELIKSFNNLLIKLRKGYFFIEQAYIANRAKEHFDEMNKIFKNIFSQKQNQLSVFDNKKISMCSATLKFNKNEIEEQIKQLNFEQANKSLINATSLLYQNLSVLQNYNDANDLIFESKSNLSILKEILQGNKLCFEKGIFKLKENFGLLDKKIISEIDHLNNLGKSLFNQSEEITQKINLLKSTERIILIYQIKKFYHDFNCFKELDKNISELIHKNYDKWVHLIDQLLNTRFYILQLRSYFELQNNESKIDDLKNCDDYLKKIENLRALINQNYFKHGDFVNEQLIELQSSLKKLERKIKLFDIIKSYTTSMFIFLNKYRYESEEIKQEMEKAEDWYHQKRYDDALNCLISLAQQIKKSAKSNNVIFN